LYKARAGEMITIYDDMQQTSVYFNLVSAGSGGLFLKPQSS